jgi:hypothetical protein
LLARGRIRYDSNHEVIEDLGFPGQLWNGEDPPCNAGLDILCGSYAPPVSNVAIINFPPDAGELNDVNRMRCVLAAAAKAYKPEWAGVMSERAKELRGYDASLPFVDWMLYVSDELSRKSLTLLPPASCERFDDSGTMIVVQDECPDPENLEHVQHIRQVDAILKAAMVKTA